MADAIVVGAGICGAAAAHFLARRGADVLVLDRAGIAMETSRHGEGNVLLCDKLPGPERELTIHGRRLWVELGERFAQGRVSRKGSLLLSPPGKHPRDAIIGGGPAMEPGLAVDAVDASAVEPALAVGVNAALEPDDLQVDAPGMARALLAGIEVRAGVTVLAADARGLTLSTGERVAAEHVVVAAGPWSGTLTGLPVQPRKGQVVALAAPPGLIAHKLIEAAYIGSVADDDAGLSIATVVEQTLDGDELLVGSSRARVGFDPVVDDRVTAAMIARASRFVPGVAELPVTRAWCGFRPWLPDHLPAIGRMRTGVWTTTGHEGSGVCLGPISGLLVAQLICGEPTVVDPSPFDPRRFQR